MYICVCVRKDRQKCPFFPHSNFTRTGSSSSSSPQPVCICHHLLPLCLSLSVSFLHLCFLLLSSSSILPPFLTTVTSSSPFLLPLFLLLSPVLLTFHFLLSCSPFLLFSCFPLLLFSSLLYPSSHILSHLLTFISSSPLSSFSSSPLLHPPSTDSYSLSSPLFSPLPCSRVLFIEVIVTESSVVVEAYKKLVCEGMRSEQPGGENRLSDTLRLTCTK